MQHNLVNNTAKESVIADEPAVHELTFSSDGVTCRAQHYTPCHDNLTTQAGTPCVVMAHGFGGTLSAGLVAYAQAFARAGLHALLFDYRHFGSSDGRPRQLIAIKRQHADWHAAIARARMLAGVDPERIVLWGVSFSGGHVVKVAADDPRIQAVVAQFPMLDGLAAVWNIRHYAGYRQLIGLLSAGLIDCIGAFAGRKPLMLPIVAPPGELAALSTPDAEPGYLAIASADWRNEVCARIALTVPWYRPGLLLRRVECPVLIQVALEDSILPAASLDRCLRSAGPGIRVARYPLKHFEAFTGKGFELCLSDQLTYLLDTFSEGMNDEIQPPQQHRGSDSGSQGLAPP